MCRGGGVKRPWLLSDGVGRCEKHLASSFCCADTSDVLFLRTDVRGPGAGRWAAEGDVGVLRVEVSREV